MVLIPHLFQEAGCIFSTSKVCKGIHINLGSSIAKVVAKLKSSIANLNIHIFINLCNNYLGFQATFIKSISFSKQRKSSFDCVAKWQLPLSILSRKLAVFFPPLRFARVYII